MCGLEWPLGNSAMSLWGGQQGQQRWAALVAMVSNDSGTNWNSKVTEGK